MRSTISRRDDRRSDHRPEPPPAPPGEAAGIGKRWPSLRIFLLALLALALLAGIHLFLYVTEHIRYPTGWDAPTAVYRARLVAATGIDQFGAIRSGAPLLLAVLMGATGRNAHTLVALLPAVLLWVGGLGVVGLVRGAYDVRPVWLPVFAFLAWTTFGENGMVNLHIDNLLNASLTLPAFAAAMAAIRWRRGAMATALLFAAAAVSHWPFYAFAVGILVVALAAYVATSYREDPRGLTGSVRSVAPLAGAVVGSAAVAGATFLARSDSGWVGARLVELRGQLRTRFFFNLSQAKTYFPYPTAILGAVLVLPRAPADRTGRRFFLALMGAWTLATIVGGIAQAAGFPTAGARELHYFFPASILTGLLVWWVARRVAAPGTALRRVAAALVVIVSLAGFGTLAVSMRTNDRSWFDHTAVKELMAASAYAREVGGHDPIVFILEVKASGPRPTQMIVRSTLPLDQLARTYMYFGSIQQYLNRTPIKRNGLPQRIPPRVLGEQGARPIVFLVQRFAPNGFREISTAQPERLVSSGLVLLRGPLIDGPLTPIDPPVGDTGGTRLATLGLAVAALLFVAGSGWSIGLLPADTLIRVTLAPALGAAATVVVALAWTWLDFPLRGTWGAAPLTVAAVAGWALVLGRRLRPLRPRGLSTSPAAG